jgi:hypothetical protein
MRIADEAEDSLGKRLASARRMRGPRSTANRRPAGFRLIRVHNLEDTLRSQVACDGCVIRGSSGLVVASPRTAPWRNRAMADQRPPQSTTNQHRVPQKSHNHLVGHAIDQVKLSNFKTFRDQCCRAIRKHCKNRFYRSTWFSISSRVKTIVAATSGNSNSSH